MSPGYRPFYYLSMFKNSRPQGNTAVQDNPAAHEKGATQNKTARLMGAVSGLIRKPGTGAVNKHASLARYIMAKFNGFFYIFLT